MERGWAIVDGIQSPILRAGGQNSPEAVVFVHGSFGSGTDWSDLVEQGGRFGRALAPDMPGFGRSDKPGDFDYTIAGYARHLGAVLDAEKVTRAHLVLHGIGAAWALAWAAGHVDKVASVTLLNTG